MVEIITREFILMAGAVGEVSCCPRPPPQIPLYVGSRTRPWVRTRALLVSTSVFKGQTGLVFLPRLSVACVCVPKAIQGLA